MCDKEEEKVVWNHLLTISAVLNPLGNAKQILKDLNASTSAKKGGNGGGPAFNEDNFLKNIMDKIGSEVENYDMENMNPMQMIGSMMSSGALNDIFQSISSGLNEGNIDLGSMMNSMQSLVGNLNTMVNEDQSSSDAVASPPSPITASTEPSNPLLEDKGSAPET
jgi:hypothetical protein